MLKIKLITLNYRLSFRLYYITTSLLIHMWLQIRESVRSFSGSVVLSWFYWLGAKKAQRQLALLLYKCVINRNVVLQVIVYVCLQKFVYDNKTTKNGGKSGYHNSLFKWRVWNRKLNFCPTFLMDGKISCPAWLLILCILGYIFW